IGGVSNVLEEDHILLCGGIVQNVHAVGIAGRREHDTLEGPMDEIGRRIAVLVVVVRGSATPIVEVTELAQRSASHVDQVAVRVVPEEVVVDCHPARRCYSAIGAAGGGTAASGGRAASHAAAGSRRAAHKTAASNAATSHAPPSHAPPSHAPPSHAAAGSTRATSAAPPTGAAAGCSLSAYHGRAAGHNAATRSRASA